MSAPRAEPHLFVIFGGTGDLARRKLLPALSALAARGDLPAGTTVLSVANRPLDDESYRRLVREPLEGGDASQRPTEVWCEQCLFYHSLQKTPGFTDLAERIRSIERERGLPGNRLLYLALPPDQFERTIEQLGETGLNQASGWVRLVVEKPFGRDLESAHALNHLLHEYFDETQIYRIDHYLGKETVQNLLVFRFANPLFESLWNRDRVESVRILVAEPGGVGERSGYYEKAGALRDMVQNHLTQLVTLVAMEVPSAFEADAIRMEKVKVLDAIEPITAADIVLGQYSAGAIDSERVKGYRDESGIAGDSTTETFAALRLRIANWRWQGVPFYLRTGKRLPQRLTRIVVRFRRAPVSLFRNQDSCEIHSNTLTIMLQPREGFELAFEVKQPGEGVRVTTKHLQFRYADAFGPLYEAYETLLLDLMQGDQTLFVHADEVEASWRLFTPILEHAASPLRYDAGSWGPPEADELAPMFEVSHAHATA
ncbi:MAG: glucose-6-phosphate dehydrogenase [Longimicrobiales bacterium]